MTTLYSVEVRRCLRLTMTTNRWRERVYRLFAVGILGFLGLLVPALPVSAAGNSGNQTHQQHSVDWGQHDTAVYVVSTLNVLHTRKGQPVVAILTKRVGIAR